MMAPIITIMMLYLDSYISHCKECRQRIWACTCLTWVKLSGQVYQAMLKWRCALKAALRMECRENTPVKNDCWLAMARANDGSGALDFSNKLTNFRELLYLDVGRGALGRMK